MGIMQVVWFNRPMEVPAVIASISMGQHFERGTARLREMPTATAEPLGVKAYCKYAKEKRNCPDLI